MCNHSRLVNKEVSEANMKQTERRSKYLKLLTNQIRLMYTRQRNCCSSPIRKRKKDFYGNLDIEIKQFWKTIKPLFSDKTASSNTIILEKDKSVTDNSKITIITLNRYSTNVVSL